MITPCPICGKPVKPDDPEQPFCSARCRLIDLGNWAAEKYVVPGESVGAPGETHGPGEAEADENE